MRLPEFSLSARDDTTGFAATGGASASGIAEASRQPDTSVGYVRHVGARPGYPRSVPSTPEGEAVNAIDDVATQGPLARQSEAPGAGHVPEPRARHNFGPALDRLSGLLPPGPAREFVRGLPRRCTRAELLVDLEAVVRLLLAGTGRG